ncbi:Protein Wiz [Camelus dromedarius]|uniref:Protein Wiz n=1 Tax=Camelus dromedarius TaxID=9838 RepID=A0A5N4E403_CAMDR|nr:Protein Wiz [Camelus dromedarius]
MDVPNKLSLGQGGCFYMVPAVVTVPTNRSSLQEDQTLIVPGPLEQVANRLSSQVVAEVPHGSKQELLDLKAQSLTTCDICGARFETARACPATRAPTCGSWESESSGTPIHLLHGLVKQKGLPDTPLGLPPSLTEKSSSPKEVVAGAPRPGLLALAKPLGAPANKSPQLPLSPRPASPKAQWPQSEDEGPLNLTSGPEPARDIRCKFFESRKGLWSHARSHLRQMGVTECAGHGRYGDKRPPLGLAPGGPAMVGRSAGTPLRARGGEEAHDLQQKLEEVRQPPPRVRPLPSLVPRPPRHHSSMGAAVVAIPFVPSYPAIFPQSCNFILIRLKPDILICMSWASSLLD